MVEPRKQAAKESLLADYKICSETFFGGLIFGGAYYWRELWENRLELTVKTAENTKITAKNSFKQISLTVHGLIFGRAYYHLRLGGGGLFLGGLIFGGAYRNF